MTIVAYPYSLNHEVQVVDMTETLAQQKLRILASNRDAHYDGLIAALGEDSVPGAKIVASRQARGGSKDAATPLLASMEASILAVLKGPLASRTVRDAEHLTYTSLIENVAAAKALGFEDGSGLVLASDALLSMCALLGMLNTEYWTRNGLDKPGLRSTWRLLKQVRSGEAVDPLTTASLRFYVVQQRVHGVAAKRVPRLTELAEDMADVLTYFAILFVLAHEAAHFALGHLQDNGAISGGPDVEFDADAFAVDIVEAVATSENLPGAGRMAVLGSMGGLLATHIAERALFVRSTHTHPPATARLAALATSRPESMTTVQGISAVLPGSIQRATDIASPITWEWWDLLHKHARYQYEAEFDADPIRWTGLLDRLCGLSPHQVLGVLAGNGQSAAPVFVEALARLAGNDLEGTLETLGVQSRKIKMLTDPEVGLTFNWLLQEVQSAETVACVDEEHRRKTAVALARCIETNIQGATHA